MYYNELDDYKFNSSLKTDCENADIEFIFYNPNSELLYDRNFNVIDKIKLNYRTNLDNNWETNPYVIFKDNGYLEEYSKQREILPTNVSMDEQIFGKTNLDILELIKSVMPNSENYQYDILCKFEFEKNYHLPAPNNSYLFVFKGNDDILYYYYNIGNEFKAGQLEPKNELKPIEIYQKIDFGKNFIFYVIKIKNNDKYDM
jgi:hypothetical protein